MYVESISFALEVVGAITIGVYPDVFKIRIFRKPFLGPKVQARLAPSFFRVAAEAMNEDKVKLGIIWRMQQSESQTVRLVDCCRIAR